MSYCEVVVGGFFEMIQKVRTPCTMCANVAHNAGGEMRSLVGVSVCSCIFLHTCSAKCSFLGSKKCFSLKKSSNRNVV